MSLRRRLALLSAAAVAVAIVLASAIVYLLVRNSLRDQVDQNLRDQASRAQVLIGAPPPGEAPAVAPIGGAPPGQTPAPAGRQQRPARQQAAQGGDTFALPPPREPGGPTAIGQVVQADGTVINPPGGRNVTIPVSDQTRQLAASGGEPSYEDVDVEGAPLRVLTQPLPEGGALQVAASLQDTEDTLSNLVLILFLVSAGGVALAAALGPVVARAALAPAGEVSDAAEEVARTHDLTRRIEVRGDDELGRLAASFNEMMAALERSEAAQRRLVADASHELRTPLATLRTNIETLGRGDELAPAERDRLVVDLTDELEEMTGLVADVVELAREPGADSLAPQDVRLDELARDAVERAQRRARELRFEQELAPTVVSGDPNRLDRAISNLLDNAAKWSPEGGLIEVRVAEGRVSVRDHGPGFAPEDVDKVFGRFWRADEARGRPGSGLGLAIVARVAEEHGGSARAANAEGGGAIVSIELPAASQPQDDS